VVDEHGHGVAVDNHGAVAESKQIGNWRVLIGMVGLIFGKQMAGVLSDMIAFSYGGSGVAAGGVDGGGADDESHAGV
jgi:hypothetical protein